MVSESDWLFNYVKSLQKMWNKKWHHNAVPLMQALSTGLMAYIGTQADRGFVITKTPSTENIDKYFDLFPDSYLIVIVRKGDDLVESGTRTFGWKYETAFYEWAASAKRILSHAATHKENNHFHIVKYEDLFANTEKELIKIFDLFGLDSSMYDFDAIKRAPILGSSELRKQGTLHWEPIERDVKFNPTSRAANWNWFKKARYEWICGDFAKELDYDSVLETKGPIYLLYNYFSDILYFPLHYYRRRRHLLKRLYQVYTYYSK